MIRRLKLLMLVTLLEDLLMLHKMLRITEDDCETLRGLEISALKDNDEYS